MESKPKFLVYDRREIWVLFLLGLFVALFAFTLGLHFGRRLQSGTAATDSSGAPGEHQPVAQPLQQDTEDKVATKDDFPIETPQGVREMSQQVVDESTAEQVEVQDLRLKEPKALDLPENTQSQNAGGTTQAQAEGAPHGKNTHIQYPPRGGAKKEEKKGSESQVKKSQTPTKPSAAKSGVSSALAISEKLPATGNSQMSGRKVYVLQVGSFPDEPSAESKVTELKSTGLDAMIEKATVKDLGLRFRVLVGKFPSHKSAAEAGRNYQNKKMIDQFFISTRAPIREADVTSGAGEDSAAKENDSER